VAFNIPRPNVIESDEGFSVEVLGPTGLRYREAGKVVFVDSEILAGPALLGVFSQNMWLEGSPRTSVNSLDEKERARIIENVRAAFKSKGFDIHVITSGVS
jgi:hypothetical protein